MISARFVVPILLFMLAGPMKGWGQESYRILYSAYPGEFSGCRFRSTVDSSAKIGGMRKEFAELSAGKMGGPIYGPCVVLFDLANNAVTEFKRGGSRCYPNMIAPITENGTMWVDISPFDTRARISKEWNLSDCGKSILEINHSSVGHSSCTDGFWEGPNRDNSLLTETSHSVIYDPTVPGHAFWVAGLSGRIHGHTNCWMRWTDIAALPGQQWFELDASRPWIQFTGVHDSLGDATLMSSDTGRSWRRVSTVSFSAVCCVPRSALVFATSADSLSGGLYVFTDTGKTFVRHDSIASYSVWFDTTRRTLFVGSTGELRRSDDTGRSMYTFNNRFTRTNVIAIGASLDGTLVCFSPDELVAIDKGIVSPYLIAPPNGALGVFWPTVLKWKAVSGQHLFHIQVATDSEFSRIVLDDSTVTATQVQMDSLLSGTHYYWRVFANADPVVQSVWSPTWTFTTMPLFPTQVQLVSPLNGDTLYDADIPITWRKVNMAEKYIYEFADNDSLKHSDSINVNPDTTFTFQVGDPFINRTFWWHMRAWNFAGWGPWSAIFHFATVPTIQQKVSLMYPANNAVLQDTNFEFRWHSVVGAHNYNFAFENELGVTVVDTFYTFQRAIIALPETLYWNVQAGNRAGWGPPSEMFQFTITKPTGLSELSRLMKHGITAAFPNPATTATSVMYSISQPTHVTLELFSAIGERLASLIDAHRDPGEYVVPVSTNDLQSGVYYYRLHAGSISESGTLLVVK